MYLQDMVSVDYTKWTLLSSGIHYTLQEVSIYNFFVLVCQFLLCSLVSAATPSMCLSLYPYFISSIITGILTLHVLLMED